MAKDPRYKSGEHQVPEETPESLEQLSTIGAVGAEIRSVRREMKIELKHIGERLAETVTAIQNITSEHQGARENSAVNLVRIKGLENRVKVIEADGKQACASDGWLKTLAKNPSLPWVVAALLGLVIVMAAVTGRGADSLIPSYQKHKPPTNAAP